MRVKNSVRTHHLAAGPDWPSITNDVLCVRQGDSSEASPDEQPKTTPSGDGNAAMQQGDQAALGTECFLTGLWAHLWAVSVSVWVCFSRYISFSGPEAVAQFSDFGWRCRSLM